MEPSGSGRRWSVRRERTCPLGSATRLQLALLEPCGIIDDPVAQVARELGNESARLPRTARDVLPLGRAPSWNSYAAREL
jgi:hypothetical protein